jgi:hypothetical protein
MRWLLLVAAVACACSGLGSKTERLFTCTACLADDPKRCTTKAQLCGALPDDRPTAEIGAKDALCDTLTPAELGRRPTPPGFKPGGYDPNACYQWTADAFAVTCTPVMTKCAKGVPIL